MNKKQRLVDRVIQKLEQRGVVFDGCHAAEAPTGYWSEYPYGFSNEADTAVERLACLNESQLNKAAVNCKFPWGTKFSDVWREWGRNGVFTCAPEVLPNDTPFFRIRHDMYLYLNTRIHVFQQAKDGWGHNIVGASDDTMYRDADIITPSRYLTTVPELWKKDWALFRRAMILAHPFTACVGKSSFYEMLEAWPDKFDGFINTVDDDLLRFKLDTGLSYVEMCKLSAYTEFSGTIHTEVAIINKRTLRQMALLRFGKCTVQMVWNADGDYKQLAILCPKWDKHAYMTEIWETKQPEVQQDECNYYAGVWTNLSIVLLTMAGLAPLPTEFRSVRAHKFDEADVVFHPADDCVDGMDALKKRINAACQMFETYESITGHKAFEKEVLAL